MEHLSDRRRLCDFWADRIRPSVLFRFFAIVLLIAPAHAGRPRDPWVFRGSLEGRPGLVFLALHIHMTVAYDTAGCSLFLAWKGKAETETGPMPAGPGSAAWGPEYRAAGPVYHKRINPSPWSLRGPQGNVPVTVRMAAAEPAGEQARLEYILTFSAGGAAKSAKAVKPIKPLKAGKAGRQGKAAQAIKVVETPEFDDHYGDNALFRTFEVTGIPAGMSLRLELGGRGMTETWGGGAVGRVEKEGDRFFLVQELDGATPLKVTWSEGGNAVK
jgi:hypothetical protein